MFENLDPIFIDECTSTQDEARKWCASPSSPSDIYWIRCGQQSSGRGRQGREWVSGENAKASLLCSCAFLWPKTPALKQTWLPLLAAQVLYEHCFESVSKNQSLLIKWPNDLLFETADGQLLKCAGILCEALSGGKSIIIGWGVNLLGAAPLETAMSLERAGFAKTTDEFFHGLREKFAVELNNFFSNQNAVALLKNKLEAKAMSKLWGRKLLFNHSEFRAIALNEDASLKVRDSNGDESSISSGEVSLLQKLS